MQRYSLKRKKLQRPYRKLPSGNVWDRLSRKVDVWHPRMGAALGFREGFWTAILFLWQNLPNRILVGSTRFGNVFLRSNRQFEKWLPLFCRHEIHPLVLLSGLMTGMCDRTASHKMDDLYPIPGRDHFLVPILSS